MTKKRIPAKTAKKPSITAITGTAKPKDPSPPKLAAPAQKERTTTKVATPLARDPRLPASGTVLQKRDRHGAVRCEAKVEKDGLRYAGTLYRSISSAGLAAARDLGLKNSTVNGFHFWGLSKPSRPARDPLEALERAWNRYRVRAEAIVKAGLADESRKKVAASVVKHAQLVEKLASALK